MSALIIRMPQEKRERLQQVAKERKLSVNKLIEEMATVAIAEHDAEVRFQVRAALGRGKAARGLSRCAKRAGVRVSPAERSCPLQGSSSGVSMPGLDAPMQDLTSVMRRIQVKDFRRGTSPSATPRTARRW
jgi:hypothetical protein